MNDLSKVVEGIHTMIKELAKQLEDEARFGRKQNEQIRQIEADIRQTMANKIHKITRDIQTLNRNVEFVRKQLEEVKG